MLKNAGYTIVDACQALGYRGAGITRRGVPVKPADPLRPSGQHSVKADQGSEVGASVLGVSPGSCVAGIPGGGVSE